MDIHQQLNVYPINWWIFLEWKDPTKFQEREKDRIEINMQG